MRIDKADIDTTYNLTINPSRYKDLSNLVDLFLLLYPLANTYDQAAYGPKYLSQFSFETRILARGSS